MYDASASGFVRSAAQFVSRRAYLLLAVAYVAAGLGCLLYVGPELRYVDETDYLAIAKNLLAKGFFSSDGINATAFRPPGYPVLIALIWAVLPSVYAVKLANLVAWAASGLLLSRLTHRFYGEIAGYLAAVVYLLYLPNLYAAATLYPQTIIGLLFVALLLIVTAVPRLNRLQLLAYAALGTLGTLVVPNFAFVVVVLGGYAVFEGRASWKSIAAAIATVVLVCLAWSLRNRLMLGDFTFATNLGFNLILGNSDNATGNSGTLVNLDQFAPQAIGLSEAAQNKFLAHAALDWMSAHPTRALLLFGEKFVNWFNTYNAFHTETGIGNGVPQAIIAGIVYYPILALAALGALRAPRGKRFLPTMVWLAYLAVALSYAIFFSRLRFRLPFDVPLIAIACGYAATWLTPALRRAQGADLDRAGIGKA